MNWSIVSSEKSAGIARSAISSSKRAMPMRSDEVVEGLALVSLALVEAEPALDRVGHALGRDAAT